MWKLIFFTSLFVMTAGIFTVPARASDVIEEDETFSTTERGRRLYERLKPWLGVIANATGGRGNGDAVLLNDGSLRFVDTLLDSDRSRVVPSPRHADGLLREVIPGFDDECTEDSLEPFQAGDDVEKEVLRLIERVVKGPSPDFGIWLAYNYYQTLGSSLFSNYEFPSHSRKWVRSTRVPEQALIPVDFFTGIGTVFLKPVYERLSVADRAAALVHASLRKGLAYYVGETFQSRLSDIEDATRKIVLGQDLESLNRAFGIPEGLALRQELVHWAQTFVEFSSELASKTKIPNASFKKLGMELAAFNQKYLSDQPGQSDAFRMAVEIQTKTEFKKRSELSPDRGARYIEWQNLIQRSGELQNSLSKAKAAQSAAGKVLLEELKRFDQGFRKQFSLTMGNSINGVQKMEKSLGEMNQLYLHPAIKPAMCALFNSLLSVDTSKDPRSLDLKNAPPELRLWMQHQ